MAEDPPKMGPFRRPTPQEYEGADRLARQARHNRRPVKNGRVAALNRLHEELADHANLYREGSRQEQRNAVAGTILSLSRYLDAQGFAEATYEPLMRPLKALTEREQNLIDPLFSERRSPNRPKRSLEQLEQAGAMAALANAWLRLRADEEGKQDDKLVPLARLISGDWFGNVSRANIKNARELVSQESKDHPAVKWADLYSGHLEVAMDMFGGNAGIEVVARFLNKTRGRSR